MDQISDSKEKIHKFIESQERKVLKKIMASSAGKATAEKYDFDHRKYICDRMIELGLVANKEAVKIKQAA